MTTPPADVPRTQPPARAASSAPPASLSARSAAILGAAYALLVLAVILGRSEPFAEGPLPAAKFLELLLPDVLRASPPHDLLVPLLLGPDEGDLAHARSGRLFAGLLPLLLAFLAVLWCGGRTALVLRVATLAAMGAALAGAHPWLPHALPLCVAVLAGFGLAALLRRDDDTRGVLPPLLVGTLSVLWAGAASMASALAGASTPAAVAAPVVERLAARGLPVPDGHVVVATAAHIVTQLDESALCALAAMGALLMLLKGRSLPWTLLVFVATCADLFRQPLLQRLLHGAS